MKKYLVLILIVLGVAVAFGQLRKMYVSKGTVTTSWTKIYKTSPQKITQLEVISDGTTSDTLYVAFEHDTTATQKFPLLAGESLYFATVYLDTVRLKASANTIPYRARYY